jgi:hypothetical protein
MLYWWFTSTPATYTYHTRTPIKYRYKKATVGMVWKTRNLEGRTKNFSEKQVIQSLDYTVQYKKNMSKTC